MLGDLVVHNVCKVLQLHKNLWMHCTLCIHCVPVILEKGSLFKAKGLIGLNSVIKRKANRNNQYK